MDRSGRGEFTFFGTIRSVERVKPPFDATFRDFELLRELFDVGGFRTRSVDAMLCSEESTRLLGELFLLDLDFQVGLIFHFCLHQGFGFARHVTVHVGRQLADEPLMLKQLHRRRHSLIALAALESFTFQFWFKIRF